MADNLQNLLETDDEAEMYFCSLPKYAQDAVKKHEKEITTYDSLHLFAETFMSDDTFRGA